MSLPKIISRVVNSNAGKKFSRYICDPKNEKFVNSTLPTAQVFLAETFGMGIVAFNPKIENEQKKAQLINHGLKAGSNLTIVGMASAATANFAEKVAKGLEKENVSEGVRKGVKIGFPLLVACVLSRYLIPVILNPLSSKLRDMYNDKFEKKPIPAPCCNKPLYAHREFLGDKKAKKIDYKA